MFGLTNYVVVTTVNSVLATNSKPVNYFDTSATVRIALDQSVARDIPGNQRVRSDIDKQTYPHLAANTVRKVYGLTGANFDDYTAYRAWKTLGLDDEVKNRDEILLIHKKLSGINLQYIADSIARNRILAQRFDR